MKKTIVYYHTGRGGRFWNSGHTTFCGTKNIVDVLQICDNSSNKNFIEKENRSDIYELLKRRGLNNLQDYFETCENEDNFSRFEKITGLDLGEDVYTDSNGNTIISVCEAETGVGRLEWDGDYDTDTCTFLNDCTEGELELINDSQEWNKESVLQEFFSEVAKIKIEWAKFNGNYSGLITDYFNFTVNIEDYYEMEEKC